MATVNVGDSKIPVFYADYHWAEAEWPEKWSRFQPIELRCLFSGQLLVVPEAIDRLVALRNEWGMPMVVNSAYRSFGHNQRVGGSPRSWHMAGSAFDIVVATELQNAFVRLARQCGFTGIGRYPGRRFVHIDLGPEREWRA